MGLTHIKLKNIPQNIYVWIVHILHHTTILVSMSLNICYENIHNKQNILLVVRYQICGGGVCGMGRGTK